MTNPAPDQPYRQPHPWELPGVVCMKCGALVFMTATHDRHHNTEPQTTPAAPAMDWTQPILILDHGKPPQP